MVILTAAFHIPEGKHLVKIKALGWFERITLKMEERYNRRHWVYDGLVGLRIRQRR